VFEGMVEGCAQLKHERLFGELTEEQREEKERKDRLQIRRDQNEKEVLAYKEQWQADIIWRSQGMERMAMKRREINGQFNDIKYEHFAREETERKAVRSRNIVTREAATVRGMEDGVTAESVEALAAQGDALYRERAVILHDAMIRGFDHMERQGNRHLLRSTLHAMRIPVLYRTTSHLLNKNRIKNWLRICARFRYLYRGMPVYHRLRTKYMCFLKWLKFLDNKFKLEEYSMGEQLRRRRKLFVRYSQLLAHEHDEEQAAASSDLRDRGFDFSNSLRGTYHRWVEFAQSQLAYKMLVRKARARSDVRLLHRCFMSLREHLKPQYTLEHRRANKPFEETCLDADIDKLRVRMLLHMRKSYSYRFRKLGRWLVKKRKATTRNQDTLKKLLDEQQAEVKRRLELERRLLFNAFEQRGVTSYQDEPIKAEVGNKDHVGVYFEDDKLAMNGCIVQVTLHHGEVVSGIELIRTSAGVMDRIPIRGVASGGTKSVFRVNHEKGEKIMGMEGIAGLRDLCSVRFYTSHKRVSPWYGKSRIGRPYKIGCCDDPDAEDATDRVQSNALLDQHIVGFCGSLSRKALASLGVVMRSTVDRNVFSECWKEHSVSMPSSNPGTASGSRGGGGKSRGSTSGSTAHKPKSGNTRGGGATTPATAPSSSLSTRRRGRVDSAASTSGRGGASAGSAMGVGGTAGTDFATSRNDGFDDDSLAGGSAEGHRRATGGGGSDAQDTQEQEEFGCVLRMRACDVRSALNRAQAFAKRMWGELDDLPDSFQRLHFVFRLSRWLFEVYACSLVKLPECAAADGTCTGEHMLSRAKEMQRRGYGMIRKADDMLAAIDGFDINRPMRPQIDASVIGIKRAKQIERDVHAAQQVRAEGDALLDEADIVAQDGASRLPRLPLTQSVLPSVVIPPVFILAVVISARCDFTHCSSVRCTLICYN
jgi:hypothetical protein